MIGQIYKKAESFGPAFEYLDGTLDPAPASIITRNLPSERVRVCERIMEAYSSLSGRTATPVYRFRVFFHPSDRVDSELVAVIVEKILDALGATELQAVIGYVLGQRHHLYVVLSRVHPEHGRVWHPRWDMIRMMSCLRALERQHGLTEVLRTRKAPRGGERHPGGFRGPPDRARRPRRHTSTPAAEPDE